MNIDKILTKIDNMFLGISEKPSLMTKLGNLFVIKNNPDVSTNNTNEQNIISSNNYSRNMNIEEICKLSYDAR